jgi:hypothetical protein
LVLRQSEMRSPRIHCLVYLAALALLGVMGCSSSKIWTRKGESVAAAINELERCPVWRGHEGTNITRKAAVLSSLSDLAQFDVAILRMAIARYVAHLKVSGAYDVDAMTKLFLLNRYILCVPKSITREEAGTFGGWVGIPRSGEYINALWPFEIDGRDTLDLGSFNVGYLGDQYLAVDEFDHFYRNYGLRFPK